MEPSAPFSDRPRVIGVLAGDIANDPSARTKYGYFFEALGRRFPLVDVHNAHLGGIARLLNALRVIHPNWQRWRQRFYKNVPAFRSRSRRVAGYLAGMQGRADVVLQLGVLFDASWGSAPLPNIIYTDYTAHLSARKPAAGRSPFTPAQRAEWLALERQAFERAFHLCTRGEFVRDSIIQDYGMPPGQVSVIGGGVNFEQLPPLHLKEGGGVPTVLFIGKNFYRKAGDLLLRAFARARETVGSARLLLLTEGPIPPDLPLEGVEVIAPTWDRGAIEALYRQADLFVLPSRLETWGDVLLEAMAYQLPCIGVKGEAMEEIILDGETGLIVPRDDVEALAAALSSLLGDEARRQQYGRAARQRVERHFTWDRVVERLEPVIEAAAVARGTVPASSPLFRGQRAR